VGGFVFLGAHRALDFVNTWTVDRGAPVERLGGFAALVDWARAAKLLAAVDAEVALARWAAQPQPAVHAEARALREAVRAWLRDPAALDPLLARVNTELSRIEPRVQVANVDGGLVTQAWLDDARPEALLRALAADVADLLCHVPRHEIRPCGARDCHLWFRAWHRTAVRTWCSNERCGGRTRTARWAERASRHR
jgi:predicted RNA-binding Zn ribbon-like protein